MHDKEGVEKKLEYLWNKGLNIKVIDNYLMVNEQPIGYYPSYNGLNTVLTGLVAGYQLGVAAL